MEETNAVAYLRKKAELQRYMEGYHLQESQKAGANASQLEAEADRIEELEHRMESLDK